MYQITCVRPTTQEKVRPVWHTRKDARGHLVWTVTTNQPARIPAQQERRVAA